MIGSPSFSIALKFPESMRLIRSGGGFPSWRTDIARCIILCAGKNCFSTQGVCVPFCAPDIHICVVCVKKGNCQCRAHRSVQLGLFGVTVTRAR